MFYCLCLIFFIGLLPKSDDSSHVIDSNNNANHSLRNRKSTVPGAANLSINNSDSQSQTTLQQTDQSKGFFSHLADMINDDNDEDDDSDTVLPLKKKQNASTPSLLSPSHSPLPPNTSNFGKDSQSRRFVNLFVII